MNALRATCQDHANLNRLGTNSMSEAMSEMEEAMFDTISDVPGYNTCTTEAADFGITDAPKLTQVHYGEHGITPLEPISRERRQRPLKTRIEDLEPQTRADLKRLAKFRHQSTVVNANIHFRYFNLLIDLVNGVNNMDLGLRGARIRNILLPMRDLAQTMLARIS